ncbi:MAG: hypothetical protein K2I35_08420, partial [Duncaniella sp.]|nr:hypothetical protein [Duncaniella sp.]
MRNLSRIILLTSALCSLQVAYSQNSPVIPTEGKVDIVNSHTDSVTEGGTVINIYQLFLDNAPKTAKKSGVP